MIVYRIAKTKFIHDLSGVGARITGGRWSRKGIGVIYTSESRALATVEYLVHVPLSYVPPGLSIASLEIPDNISNMKEIQKDNLPTNWRDYPAPQELANVGTKWVLSNETLLLRVPSAVVEEEYNILINPLHPDMNQVKILSIKKYRFDNRLLQKKSRK